MKISFWSNVLEENHFGLHRNFSPEIDFNYLLNAEECNLQRILSRQVVCFHLAFNYYE